MQLSELERERLAAILEKYDVKVVQATEKQAADKIV